MEKKDSLHINMVTMNITVSLLKKISKYTVELWNFVRRVPSIYHKHKSTALSKSKFRTVPC